MINSISSSTNSTQLFQSIQPTSPAQLNRQALQTTTTDQQNLNATQTQQPQPGAANLPPNLGQNINVVA